MINYGASITLVAKYLGHTKIDETLNPYSHMYQNKLEDIVKLINQNAKQIKEENLIENDTIDEDLEIDI